MAKKKGLQLILPIVVGNQAEKLSDDAPEKRDPAKVDHTHRWKIYVRGANNEDISYFVDRVTIKLHESFPDHRRTSTHPPYEVNETGWGEFEVEISIHLKYSPDYKPVKLAHMLRLFPPDEDHHVQPSLVDPSRPGIMVTERLDEIIVTEPSEELFEAMVKHHQRTYPINGPVFNAQFEAAELAKYERVQKDMRDQTAALEKRLHDAQLAMQRLKTGH
ncbi:yeats family-domain-containing protein [Catenaria anguillulae PL171]|uniref:Protein AF-9 homolog n=1 Tax=Catenaria anguillulae PL171 TaxID=765915 RepID=A0A1Y2I171_9FUNG|nr:yeats family-domain-containing protein [Catenaria anguillulae PL171]